MRPLWTLSNGQNKNNNVYEAYCDSAEQTLIEGLTVAVAKNRLGIEVKKRNQGADQRQNRLLLQPYGSGAFFYYAAL